MSLPDRVIAEADPADTLELLKALVKASLAEDWRQEHRDPCWLKALEDLARLYLEGMQTPRGGGDADPSEEACALTIKLSRNLCVNATSVQQHFWESGFVDELLQRVRSDSPLPDERGAIWSEAVPSFLSNVIAGNQEMRQKACKSWLPSSATMVCALCSRRPELAFMFLQTLVSNGQDAADSAGDLSDAPSTIYDLVATDDGHCMLFVLTSLLFKGGLGMEKEPVNPKALEWAAVFFHTLWMWGGFEAAYRGLKRITVNRLHSFWCTVNGFPPACATAPPGVLEQLVGRLCTRAEVLGFVWHTIEGLESKPLSERLLRSTDFVALASEELAVTATDLAEEFNLPLRPAKVTVEVADLLGIATTDVDVDALVALSRDCMEGEILDGDGSGSGQLHSGSIFGDVCKALMTLSATDRKPGSFPGRLIGACLVVNVAFIDALHHFRFGDLSTLEPKKKPPPEVNEASRKCHLIDQIRLCANVLYEDRRAQDFLRQSGCLRVLLSNCYADDELPLLRETGVFAVRNATHQNPENQAMAREMITEQRRLEAAGQEAGSRSGNMPALVEVGL